VAFIANLMEAGADFVAVDMPHANKLTIHILSAVAEHEREMISQRTRAALAAAKSRGVQLGNRSNIKVAQARSRAARMAQADQFASNILPVILQIRGAGVQTLKGIADALNARGLRTPRGGEWQAIQVKRIVASSVTFNKHYRSRGNGCLDLQDDGRRPPTLYREPAPLRS
jgi:DNA invertase Pin-like site-specific DNA recombinase